MILYKIDKELKTKFVEIVAIWNRIVQVSWVIWWNSKTTTQYILWEEVKKVEQTSFLWEESNKLLKPKNIIFLDKKNNHSLEENIKLILEKKIKQKLKQGWLEDINKARQLDNSYSLLD